MKNYKCNIMFMFFIIIFGILFFNSTVYATTCELSIKDEGNENGFVTNNGQLYYVVTISEKTIGGNLSSIKFQIKYDEENLEIPNIEETLDLGEKGKFEKKPYKILYDKWSKVKFNTAQNCYIAENIKASDLTSIEDEQVDLIKLCFKVKDNKNEKRLVYINQKAETTQILYAYTDEKEQYITTGVPMPEEIIEAEENNNLQDLINKTEDSTNKNENTPNKNIQEEKSNENQKESKNENKQQNGNNAENANTAPIPIPKAGLSITILIIAVIIICISIIFGIKSKRIKNMMKF